MKHQKYTYRLLVVTLVVLAFSFVSVGSLAHAKTLSATDQSVDSTNPVADSTMNATVDALAAQAAAAGIGVRIVNGVRVFHMRDGRDLEMVKICDGSDGVKFDGEVMTLEDMFAWQLHPEMYTEVPGDSDQGTMSALSIATIPPVCYSQEDSLWANVLVGTSTLPTDTMYNVGCYVTSAAMEAASYGVGLYDYLADPQSLNTWLKAHAGFSGSDITFSAMSSVPGIGGTEQSWMYNWTTAQIYSRARAFITGTVPQHSEYKASLPIIKMLKPGYTHYCAWYGSDGSSIPSQNFIVQPKLYPFSDTSLKCSAASGTNGGYSPVNDSYLMRVAWKQ